MRNVIVISHGSLDGVIQAMGGPNEDPTGGFAYHGWIAPYSDDVGGKRLFADGTIPAAFKMTGSQVSPKGVIIANYERAGAVKTGSVK